jgi:hypothetical protein
MDPNEMPVTAVDAYPIVVDIDAPVRQNRWTVAFRIILAFPHLLIVGGAGQFTGLQGVQMALAFVAWWTILFTGHYPRSMFTFAEGLQRWTVRSWAYVALLNPQFPPFGIEADPASPVRYGAFPETESRNRLTTFFRLFMVLPHVIVLVFLWIAAVVTLIIAWFAALFTAQVPAGMHGFLAGVLRWTTRAVGYLLLLTDRYPPFSLE